MRKILVIPLFIVAGRSNMVQNVKQVIVIIMTMITGAISAVAGAPNKVYIESTGATLPDSVCTTGGYGEKHVYQYDNEGRVIREEEYSSNVVNVWKIRTVMNCAFDAQGRETLHEEFWTNNHTYFYGTKIVTEYVDEENKILISEYSKEGEWDTIEEEEGWKLVELGEKLYSSEKQLLTATFRSPNSDWMRKYSYAYTEEGKPLAIEVVQRESGTTEFHPWRNIEWTYGKNSGTVLEKKWINETEGMRNARKYDYKLDEYGDTLLTTEYYWSPESDSWEGFEKYENKYDDQHRMVERRCYEPGRLLWYELVRFEFKYGQHGLERMIEYSFYDGEMEVSNVFVYSYSESGQPEQEEWYAFDWEIGDFYLYALTRYYYGQSGIEEPVIAPSVRMSGLTLELGEPQQVSVYSVSGHLVYSGWSTSVDLPAPGLYLVRTNDGCTKVVAR